MPTSRLEAFSDGVLAIIITVMVLELKAPEGSSFGALLHAAGTGLLSYLLSFIYVGIYWNNHHHMFQLVNRVSGGVLWGNLSLLFFLSLFPYTTAWMDDTGYARVPVLAYGTNLLLAAIAWFILQAVIIRHQGSGSPLAKAVGRDNKGRLSLVLYVAGICCGLPGERFWTWLALGCYVVVALAWIIPDRRIDRIIRDHGAPD
ncbi:MAG: DUF1211 domain-containing protein [Nocardiopsaceae bacterium]|nr:DUF1211 domain-containing protein [Nocardiopsaceae bacterium]